MKNAKTRRPHRGGAHAAPAGRPELVITVSRDATESRLMREREKAMELQLMQAEKLNALGMSLSGVAHELNNPLTAVMGYCQLLLREDDIQRHTRHREDLETIFKEAARCQKIIRNLSTFARQHKPEKTFLGINGLVKDILRLEEHNLRARNVEPHLDLDEKLPKTMADYHQMQQVMLNLLINAVEALAERKAEGGVWIRTLAADGSIRIVFEDNGPGIPEENLGRIFEPFFTTKPPGKGTGLGLSISYGIISEHGGRIWAENHPGGGARFVVELPILEPPAEPRARESAAKGACPAGARVLIVDDEQAVLDVVFRMLRQMEIAPDVARSATAAKAKLEQSDYAAVLCDYRLPGMSGLDLFEWAKTAKPDMAARWVFITGSIDVAELEATGRPVLHKPFTIQEFREKVAAVLAP